MEEKKKGRRGNKCKIDTPLEFVRVYVYMCVFEREKE